MTGRTYLEHGQPVTVLARWADTSPRLTTGYCQAVPCPRCGMPPGAACTSGRRRAAPHASRRKLAGRIMAGRRMTRVIWLAPPKPSAPRNVLVERGDGTRTIRPFRGLRKGRQ